MSDADKPVVLDTRALFENDVHAATPGEWAAFAASLPSVELPCSHGHFIDIEQPCCVGMAESGKCSDECPPCQDARARRAACPRCGSAPQ